MRSSFTRRDFLNTAAVAGLTALAAPTVVRAAEPVKRKIKVGQIGTGHAHASKLAVYRRSPDYEVVGIVESDPELRGRAEKQAVYRDLPWMSAEQLLNISGLEAVLVETLVRDLLRAAEQCVEAGKHVHLDKPAGQSLMQYRRLLDSAAKQKLLVQMGYMYRYSPAVVLLRQMLKDGWLGDIFEVHTVMSKVVPDGARRELAEFRGGMMFELGCHVIDSVIGVLGRPERVQSVARHSGSQQDGLADNMLALLEYPKATATVRSTGLEVDGGSRRHFVVCGTAGAFHIQPLDAPQVKLTLDRDRGEYRKGTQDVRFGRFERYVADAADMARILRGEKESDFPYSHDLAVQETVLLASGMPTDV